MKSVYMAIIVCMTLQTDVSAKTLIPRAVFPKTEFVNIQESERWDLLVIKFVEGSGIRFRDGRFVSSRDVDTHPMNAILDRYPGTRIARLFSRPESVYDLERDEGQLRTGRELADLNLYFALGPKNQETALRLLDEFHHLDSVECIYPEPIPELAYYSFPDYLTPPSYVESQDYLEASPTGVNAYAAWSYEGGKGEQVKMVDVELAWNWSHFDLPSPFFTAGTPSSDMDYINHGTAVMGEIRGIENAFGVTGIAPLVPVGGVAIAIDDWPDNVGSWFDIASAALDPGDVWLIELHGIGPNGNYVPMEWWQANYDAIANSTALGRICVEAGGNGSENLDAAIYQGKFDRSVRDSLAIMVGAGTPYAMQPEWFTNYGSRMDANGWGSQIITTGYGDLYSGEGINYYYTQEFGGTSGASPMIVGVCCVAQSIYKTLSGDVLSPNDLRQIITDTGAPQPEPVTKYIGPRPDLESLLQHEIFNVSGIRFDRNRYMCSDTANLTVIDRDATESVFVTVRSTSEPAGETFELLETEPGHFANAVPLSEVPAANGDGLISVSHDDQLEAEYLMVPDSAIASVDCEAPVISIITISGLTDNSATINWITDEISSSIVRYGTENPDQVEADLRLETEHHVHLDNLDECTEYVFMVTSIDEAGNTTTDDNAGNYYILTTMERIVLLNETMDSHPGWIGEGLWNWGLPTGNGGDHGQPDPLSGYSGSNVFGYNLNGGYENNLPATRWLQTSAIDCSNAQQTTFGFWCWLGVEQNIYDHAFIEVSNNGTSWTTVWENGPVTLEGGNWEWWEFSIADIADEKSAVYLRWGMGTTDLAWTYCGWN
ncbi:S8 family serine peptidase, partial [bacterium]|nr:S8 family serine peptidase [candidate division CSSED10-310 bacterium]